MQVSRRGPLRCDRRTVLAGGGCGLAAILAPTWAVPGDGRNLRRDVSGSGLAFFADRPMIDPSGSLPAYRPPSGYRAGAPFARMDERARRALDPFMPG